MLVTAFGRVITQTDIHVMLFGDPDLFSFISHDCHILASCNCWTKVTLQARSGCSDGPWVSLMDLNLLNLVISEVAGRIQDRVFRHEEQITRLSQELISGLLLIPDASLTGIWKVLNMLNWQLRPVVLPRKHAYYI